MSGVAGAHLESVLENEIAGHLAANDWLYSPTDAGYDRELALFPEDVLGWLADTQPSEFAKVVPLSGEMTGSAGAGIRS